MAHGFGGERRFKLPDYAAAFASAGLAAFLFDYRCLGESEGAPRGLVSYRRQRQDWEAAIDHVRRRTDVDASRIALWGTSYSGGHVIAVAAAVPGVAAIVSQIPMVDVPASLPRFGARFVVEATWHGLCDLARMATGRPPHMVPVVGPPKRFAYLNRPGCEAGYRSLIPSGVRWDNRCPARELLFALGNRSAAVADRVECPALLVAACADQLIPIETIRRTAARMPRATLIEVAGDHFCVYQGDVFERLVAEQTRFLVEHLVTRCRGVA
jgi:alpha/beta superfamily hydrolase